MVQQGRKYSVVYRNACVLHFVSSYAIFIRTRNALKRARGRTTEMIDSFTLRTLILGGYRWCWEIGSCVGLPAIQSPYFTITDSS